jgi:hypothetical protein
MIVQKKQLDIPFLILSSETTQIEYVSQALDRIERQQIDIVPWLEYHYQPNVAFAVGHNGNNIFLKYFVEEEAVTAIHRETNGPVYKDSCVEFFVAFNDDEDYYNIEFNCAGSCHVGFGSKKQGRRGVPNLCIEEIRHMARFKTAGVQAQDLIQWELTVIIPISVFYYHQLKSLNNIRCSLNFYKCGDDLPQAHFVSWTNINSESPNFHLPEYFGIGHFLDDKTSSQAK